MSASAKNWISQWCDALNARDEARLASVAAEDEVRRVTDARTSIEELRPALTRASDAHQAHEEAALALALFEFLARVGPQPGAREPVPADVRELWQQATRWATERDACADPEPNVDLPREMRIFVLGVIAGRRQVLGERDD